MYYPRAIREDAPSSSEARDASEEVEATGTRAVLAITSPEETTKESEPSGAIGVDEGQNPNAPQKTAEPASDASISPAEGPALLVEPLQAVPLGEGSKDLETSPAQLSEGKATQGSFCFVFFLGVVLLFFLSFGT